MKAALAIVLVLCAVGLFVVGLGGMTDHPDPNPVYAHQDRMLRWVIWALAGGSLAGALFLAIGYRLDHQEACRDRGGKVVSTGGNHWTCLSPEAVR